MKVKDLERILFEWALPSYAENYDNVGLLVGDYEEEVRGVLINLDLTEAVLEEAIQKDCNVILTHHPIWFLPKKRLIPIDYTSRIIRMAIQANLNLMAMHTNLDNVLSGVNAKIAQKLGMQVEGFLQPKNLTGVNIGSGMYGILDRTYEKKDFLQWVKETFRVPCLRYSDTVKTTIQRIGICGGAGSFLIPEVARLNLDAFITADISYHKFFDNEGKFLLIDAGHYETEQYTSELFLEFLKKNTNFAVHLSNIHTNPIQYYF